MFDKFFFFLLRSDRFVDRLRRILYERDSTAFGDQVHSRAPVAQSSPYAFQSLRGALRPRIVVMTCLTGHLPPFSVGSEDGLG